MSVLVDEKIPLAVRGFNSVKFCTALSDVLANEAFIQYGKIDAAVIAFRIKCHACDVVFIDNHGRKNWERTRRETADWMYKIIGQEPKQESFL